MIDELCASCNRSVGLTVYVIHGYLGSYRECEWCFEGRPRPSEPELITDTFTRAAAPSSGLRSLDLILDKLTGERRT